MGTERFFHLVGRGFWRKTGYHDRYKRFNRGLSVVLSAFFVLVSFPLFLLIFLVTLKLVGWPVFYAGERMGHRKRIFKMFKFRTLPKDFEQKNDAMLVSYAQQYSLPRFCRFMRDSRLDELPQLFNILKGDMDFVGPRPIRPSVYHRLCRNIKDYDKRFLVNPGLIGYSQLFTPHSAPKRIRSFIDNRAARFEKRPFVSLFVIWIAVYAVLWATACQVQKYAFRFFFLSKVLNSYNEKRGMDRHRQRDGRAYLITGDCIRFEFSEEPRFMGKLIDMNEQFFRVDTHTPFEGETVQFILKTSVKTHISDRTTKSAFCTGTLYKCYPKPNESDVKFSYIIRYEAMSDLNQYFLDQYFLKKSLMRYVF